MEWVALKRRGIQREDLHPEASLENYRRSNSEIFLGIVAVNM
jgi:hypothetical protein